jgi:hypothetical protein
MDLAARDEDYDRLLADIRAHTAGTRYVGVK